MQPIRFFSAGIVVLFVWSALETRPTHAQIRKITLNVIEEESLVTITGSVKIAELDDAELALVPQKDGVAQATFTGLPSNTAQSTGTIEAIVDLDNDIIQLTGGIQHSVDSGLYCPPPFPVFSSSNDNRECPTESPGAFAFRIAGDVHSVSRDGFATLRGQSQINGTEIDVLNWHGYIITSRSDFDGTTVLDNTTGTLPFDQRWNATDNTGAAFNYGDTPANKSTFDNLDRATLVNAGHYENDPQADDFTGVPNQVDEATFYKGSFEIDGEQATITIPVWNPALLAVDLTDRAPNDFVRVLFEGQTKATGTFGDVVIPGDANTDGVVDGLDVNIYSKHFGKGAGYQDSHTPDFRENHVRDHPKYANFFEGDFNLDSEVNDLDGAILNAAFGAGSGSGFHSVPEPHTLLLAVFGLACTLLTSTVRTSKHGAPFPPPPRRAPEGSRRSG